MRLYMYIIPIFTPFFAYIFFHTIVPDFVCFELREKRQRRRQRDRKRNKKREREEENEWKIERGRKRK